MIIPAESPSLETFVSNNDSDMRSLMKSAITAVGEFATRCREAARRLFFGERLIAYNPFVEVEKVVGFDGQDWAIAIRDDIYLVASISREIPEQKMGRAVILASGPSLLDTLPADKEPADVYFALNGAARFLTQFADSRCYLTVNDRIFARGNPQLILASLQQGVILLTTPECLLVLVRCCPSIIDYFAAIRLFQVVGDPYGCVMHSQPELNKLGLFPVASNGGSPRVGWSSRIDYGVFSGATVAFPALQIAVGMLASIVEFHGLDLNDKGRAYHEDKAVQSKLERHYAKFILPSFKAAGNHLKGTGILVRNNSPHCPIAFAELFDQ